MPLNDWPAESRPREKILTRGPGALSDAELLALLLRTGTPGQHVLQLAQSLLDDPGGQRTGHPAADGAIGLMTQGNGLAGLMTAGREGLRRHKGLGPAKQATLLAVMEIARRVLAQRLSERQVMSSPGVVRDYLQMQLAHQPHEVFAVMFLDSQNQLIAMEEMFRGTLNQTSVYPREVVLRALHHRCAAVVLAHNHPSGSVQPSRADEHLTQHLKASLALIDVRVLDHVIVAQGQSLSMLEQGLL